MHVYTAWFLKKNVYTAWKFYFYWTQLYVIFQWLKLHINVNLLSGETLVKRIHTHIWWEGDPCIFVIQWVNIIENCVCM